MGTPRWAPGITRRGDRRHPPGGAAFPPEPNDRLVQRAGVDWCPVRLVWGRDAESLARLTAARMDSADLVHRNGLAERTLCSLMKRWISLRSSSTLVKTPRWMARRSRDENQLSTALSQEALVGVKCT